MTDAIEWPREIWMAEREEHDQGVISGVLSEAATVARWEGDKERDLEFHRYVDADIYESADRYWRERCEKAEREAEQWMLGARAMEQKLSVSADFEEIANALRPEAQDGVASAAHGHAVNLEQCSVFARDAGKSIEKAMLDAAAFLRALQQDGGK